MPQLPDDTGESAPGDPTVPRTCALAPAQPVHPACGDTPTATGQAPHPTPTYPPPGSAWRATASGTWRRVDTPAARRAPQDPWSWVTAKLRRWDAPRGASGPHPHASALPDAVPQHAADTSARSSQHSPAGQVAAGRRAVLPRSWPVWVVAGLAFAAYLTLSLARWHRMAAPSWDLAIFEQAVKGWASGHWPIVDIKGPGFNQLGDHFSPFLVLLAPFYKLFPTPVTLLVAQCVLVALSVVPIGLVAREKLGPRGGLAITIAYAASWGIQSAIDVQFHEYALAAPVLAMAMAAFLRERWRTSVIWMALLLGIKEDLGLTVAMFGVLLWLRGQRKLGAWVAGAGAAATALILFVIVPAFNPSGQWDYWGRLDQGGAAQASTLDNLLAGWDMKFLTVLLLVLITAMSALFSPIALLAIPTLMWRFASPTEVYWGVSWHYSLILMPIMFAAAIDGVAHLRGSPRRWMRDYSYVAPWVMLLIPIVLVGQFPFRDLAKPSTYAASGRQAAALEVLDMIPDGATVASDTGLITLLPGRATVYWIEPNADIAPSYVLVDEYAGWGENPPKDIAAYAHALYPRGEYRTAYDNDGYLLAERID